MDITTVLLVAYFLQDNRSHNIRALLSKQSE
jgi:hypothetical protein